MITKGADSIGSKAAAVDAVDGVVLQNGSPHESPTKKSDAFVIDLDDQPSKENDASMISKKPATRKLSSDVRPSLFAEIQYEYYIQLFLPRGPTSKRGILSRQ
jgi:hypothetical protein